MNVAIDGYAACGKSTLARDLAQSLKYIHLDTGLMYRAASLYYLRLGTSLEEFQSSVDNHLNRLNLDIKLENRSTTVLMNGENVTPLLRTPRIDAVVSDIAAIKAVRLAMVSAQQRIAQAGGTVMDGRDIGTHVLPNARVKIFLTADILTRAKRRQLDLQKSGINKDLQWVKNQLLIRDEKDTTRTESPLRKAKDAVVIDNTNLNKIEQLKIITTLVECRM